MASVQVPSVLTSKLSNGLTVATETIPHTSTATVGVWIDAGSRADLTDKTSGTAHFLEHLAFKGTSKRSQLGLELEVENCGSHLNAYTSRENTVYYAKSTKQDVGRAVDILSDILTKSRLERRAIENERSVIIRESEEVDKMYDEVVFDRLHEVCFKKQPLGRTILGPIDSIKTITQRDLKHYIETNYKGDRMVLVGVGCVDHGELVKLAQENFGHVPLSEKPLPLGAPRGDLPNFYGGDVRIQDNTLPATHIALALEGVSWNAIDYFTALTAQAIVGSWDRAQNPNTSSPLALSVAEGKDGVPLANSYMSFSTSYSDTGLWGMYLTVEKDTDCKHVVESVQKEWKRLCSGAVSDEELEMAKAQLKGSLVLSLDGSTAIAEDIGRQIVTTGRRMSPEEVFEKINNVTKADVVGWCKWRIEGQPIAVAALGNVKTLPSHAEIQRGMS